jgi:hypothetical protein
MKLSCVVEKKYHSDNYKCGSLSFLIYAFQAIKSRDDSYQLRKEKKRTALRTRKGE